MRDISHLKKSKVSQVPNLCKVECLDKICVKPRLAQQPGLLSYFMFIFRLRLDRVRIHTTYRKLNRQRSIFPSDTVLLKALYLSTFEALKKWTMPLRETIPAKALYVRNCECMKFK